MDQARYYPGVFDVSQLAMQLASNLQLRAYQAQWFGAGNQMMVQVRKGGDAAKLFGMQAALTVMLTQHPTGLLVTLGQQRWLDKAAVGVAAIWLWPLIVPAAVGAVRQSSLPAEVLSLLDTLVLQQNPMAFPAPVPVFLMPQVQMVYQTPPAGVTMTVPQQLCPACHQPNNTGATFCQHCGTPLDASAAQPSPVSPAAPAPPPTAAPAPPPPPAPKPAPPRQTAPATTRVSRTAQPTERVSQPVPVGPTGVFALPSGRRVPIVAQEAIVGRGNPDGTDPVEVDMTTEAESTTVSRRHARITRANSGFEVEDLGSANQTFLNNEQLTPGRRYLLRKGDVVEFGKVKCTFSVQEKER
jgi:outer membrane biosynthesis protein TonB